MTSETHGNHVAHSAHYDGRAIDIGAFGGQEVGYNKNTWDALRNIITWGGVQKIGTTKALAQKIAPYAQQYGVEVFVDEGSGHHVHVQVAE